MLGPGMIQHLNAKGAMEDLLQQAEDMDLYPYDEIFEDSNLHELLMDWFIDLVSVSDLMQYDRPASEVFHEDYFMNMDEWPTDAYELVADLLTDMINEAKED